MPKDPDLTIFEVTQLNKTMKFLELAKEHSPVGREKLREAMKAAGARFNQVDKRWHIEEDDPNASKKVTDFVTSVRMVTGEPKKKTAPKKKEAAEPLVEDIVTGQTSLNDDFFDIVKVEEKIEKRRLTFDISKDVHKRLKLLSIEKEIPMGKIIGDVLDEFLKKHGR